MTPSWWTSRSTPSISRTPRSAIRGATRSSPASRRNGEQVVDAAHHRARRVAGDAGRPIFYQKQMAHHLLPSVDRSALKPLRHAFLIRAPGELLASYAKVRAQPDLDDLGLRQQVEILPAFGGPVVDSRDILDHPERTLRALCEALDVPFDERCSRGHPGRGRATACGRATGMTASGARPGSCATAHRPGRCHRGWLRCSPLHALSTHRCVRGASGHRQRGESVLQTFDERNRDLIVNVGGRLTHRDEAGVSPFDSAVQGGDAVWEGLRLAKGGSSGSPSISPGCAGPPRRSRSRRSRRTRRSSSRSGAPCGQMR